MAMRMTNRYPLDDCRLEIGVSRSGVESFDPYIENEVLPFSSILTPPPRRPLTQVGFVFEKEAGGKYTTRELPSIKTVIKPNP